MVNMKIQPTAGYLILTYRLETASLVKVCRKSAQFYTVFFSYRLNKQNITCTFLILKAADFFFFFLPLGIFRLLTIYAKLRAASGCFIFTAQIWVIFVFWSNYWKKAYFLKCRSLLWRIEDSLQVYWWWWINDAVNSLSWYFNFSCFRSSFFLSCLWVSVSFPHWTCSGSVLKRQCHNWCTDRRIRPRPLSPRAYRHFNACVSRSWLHCSLSILRDANRAK